MRTVQKAMVVLRCLAPWIGLAGVMLALAPHSHQLLGARLRLPRASLVAQRRSVWIPSSERRRLGLGFAGLGRATAFLERSPDLADFGVFTLVAREHLGLLDPSGFGEPSRRIPADSRIELTGGTRPDRGILGRPRRGLPSSIGLG